MRIQEIYNAEEITKLAKERFQEERKLDHLEGWFLAREIAMECDELYKDDPDSIRIGKTLIQVMKRIPLTIGNYHVFAGTQDDAFARSYALINPAFQVSSFTGYCDPTAVFGDIDPMGDITEERIAKVKDYYARITELETDINITVDGGNAESKDTLLIDGGTAFSKDYDKYNAGHAHTV